ncbi:MAG TPA: hypothetical protein VLH84_04560 [Patescibacteria group bacterium]|nr:hypothetical protein [Patescibacteria group bacterium]
MKNVRHDALGGPNDEVQVGPDRSALETVVAGMAGPVAVGGGEARSLARIDAMLPGWQDSPEGVSMLTRW